MGDEGGAEGVAFCMLVYVVGEVWAGGGGGGLELRVGALGVELEGKLLERLELLHEELLLVAAHEFGGLLVERAVECGQEDFRLVQNEPATASVVA